MERKSGILLHITSLPSNYGIGDLGPGAYGFVDFLSETGQSCWQILPLSRTARVYGNSPYSSYSAFAGNPMLISPDLLLEEGILSPSDIAGYPSLPARKVNYHAVVSNKKRILEIAYEKSKERLSGDSEFQGFLREHSGWLDDYCLFIALKGHFREGDWSAWDGDLRDRKESLLQEWGQKLREPIAREKFFQFIFFKQWFSLKTYCEGKNIRIIGDIPIYVNYDSADVWTNSGLFGLDEAKKPLFVTGVPPDYFSSTGQLWGHPVYNWEALRKSGYSWWIQRLEHNLRLFHLFRLDHFRGFIAYWRVKAGEKTAVRGEWVEAPGSDFFSVILGHFPRLPLIAEDLGVITPDVRSIINLHGFPGMKVLMFAFGEDIPVNAYAPHNHIKNCVVYTGTHDNNTIKGWFRNELGPEGRRRVSAYLGRKATERNIHWELIRLALGSVADLVIIPIQDILGLGEKSRMNLPGSMRGNWEWRLVAEQLTPAARKKLFEMTRIYGRT